MANQNANQDAEIFEGMLQDELFPANFTETIGQFDRVMIKSELRKLRDRGFFPNGFDLRQSTEVMRQALIKARREFIPAQHIDEAGEVKGEEDRNAHERAMIDQTGIVEIQPAVVDQQVNARFPVAETKYRLEMPHGYSLNRFTSVELIEELFGRIVQKTVDTLNLNGADTIRVIVRMNDNQHISARKMPLNGLNMRDLAQHVADGLQSYQTIDMDSEIIVQSIRMPVGGARRRAFTEADRISKQSIIQVKNNDNLCLFRALAICLGRLELDEKPTDKVLRNNYKYLKAGRKLQKTRAEALLALCVEAGGEERKEDDIGYDFGYITLLEEKLGETSISVLNERLEFVYPEESKPKAAKQIYLFFKDNHYDAITSITGFLGVAYFCKYCRKGYSNKDSHRCEDKRVIVHCGNCKRAGKCAGDREEWQTCDACNIVFKTASCFDVHIEIGLCAKRYRCVQCNRHFYDHKISRDDHECGKEKCKNCGLVEDLKEHLCYIQKGDFMPPSEKYLFYDFETYIKPERRDRCYDIETGELSCMNEKCNHVNLTHTVNLAMWSYMKPLSELDRQRLLQLDGIEEYSENGRPFSNMFKCATIDQFCTMMVSRVNYGMTLIAHNAKGYDHHPILRWMRMHGMKPYVIYSGAKIMYMNVSSSGLNLRFVDSLNFIPTGLAMFPKNFGIKELKKGYFPHAFNRPENWDYIGPLPDVGYYNPQRMKPDDNAKFMEWYNNASESKAEWNFQTEFEGYCRSDVALLREGCINFRQQYIENCGVDPFRYTTIASLCQTIYRTSFMPENTIATQKASGSVNTSNIQFEWLEALRQGIGCDAVPNIQHAHCGGEYKVPGTRISCDGYDPISNTIYEFLGDFWHGNPHVYRAETMNPTTHCTMGALYSQTMDRAKRLRNRGYNVVQMWENDWNMAKITNPAVKEWVDTRFINPRELKVNHRDTLSGGRCEVFKLHYKCSPGEKIHYVDFTSLYPTVNYGSSMKLDGSGVEAYEYPVGHPTEILGSDNNQETLLEGIISGQVFGFVKATVIPPKDLYLPLLGRRDAELKKFVFDLNRMTWSWCTPELKKAIELGYHVERIHAITKYEERTQDLFRDYVECFLKVKQESSGWPKWCKTEEQKTQYINDYRDEMGIELDRSKIAKNPGRRLIAKLCLNSLWGKFAMRQNMGTQEIFRDPAKFNALLYDESVDQGSIVINSMTDEYIDCTRKLKNEFIPDRDGFRINIAIASFTTCYARLKLYSALEIVGDRALYCDTDSIIYVQRSDDDVELQLGDKLGDLTDELDDIPGADHIVEYVGTAPKSYGFRTDNNEIRVKMKGFTLNVETIEKANYETLIKMARQGVSDEVDDHEDRIDITRFQIDKSTNKIRTINIKRVLRLAFDKRQIGEITEKYIDTIPHGYEAN